jgi:hypothetical protein
MHYGWMMRESVLAAAALAVLAGCTSQSKVDVTTGAGKVQTNARSEPIFYNGQHYNVNYTYNETLRLFNMKVRGTSVAMTANDKNAATAIATSALRYFACPDSQSSRLIGQPQFAAAVWSMQARCA